MAVAKKGGLVPVKIRLLNQDEIRQTLTMASAIELMKDAFIALTQGTIETPLRTNISNSAGTLLYKPALMPSAKVFGMKAVSVFPRNVDLGLPVTTGLMLINDSETGLPVALMDAQYLTSLRTGAATGLATRLLAKPGTTVAALIGTGGQAASQLRGMLEVLPLETVYVLSRQMKNAEQFCRAQQEFAGTCRLEPAASNQVLADCSVITTATTSKSPVFNDAEIQPGVHINGVGSFTPDASEIPQDTVCRSHIFVDQREAALREAGDLVQPLQNGKLAANFSPTEIGELLLGLRSGRNHEDETTFFKSVGNAAQDIVCAARIVDLAEKNQLGQVVEM